MICGSILAAAACTSDLANATSSSLHDSKEQILTLSGLSCAVIVTFLDFWNIRKVRKNRKPEEVPEIEMDSLEPQANDDGSNISNTEVPVTRKCIFWAIPLLSLSEIIVCTYQCFVYLPVSVASFFAIKNFISQ